MTKWTIKPLDRESASAILAERAHHLQSTLEWFDFIRDFSGETDRSVSIEYCGEEIGFFCALQHRNLIQSLPYPASYAGIQTSKALSVVEMQELCQALFAHYSRYCDVMTLCTGPFFRTDTGSDRHFDYCSTKDVHFLELTSDQLANTTSKFRNNLRRNLQKAEKARVTISVSTDRGDLAKWYRCYDQRMKELGGVLLPEKYFTAMFDCLEGRGNCSLITAKAADKFVGGIVTVQNRHCVDYYLSMFDRRYDEMQASTAAFQFLVNYAKELGAPILNLQSSPVAQTDLIRFKESWGAQRAQHGYLTKIVNNRDRVLSLSESEIKKNYQFHYLLPFEALQPEMAHA